MERLLQPALRRVKAAQSVLRVLRHRIGKRPILKKSIDLPSQFPGIVRIEQQDLTPLLEQAEIVRAIRNVPRDDRPARRHAFEDSSAIELGQAWQIDDRRPLGELRHPFVELSQSNLLQRSHIVGHIHRCDRPAFAEILRGGLLHAIEEDLISAGWMSRLGEGESLLQGSVVHPALSPPVRRAMKDGLSLRGFALRSGDVSFRHHRRPPERLDGRSCAQIGCVSFVRSEYVREVWELCVEPPMP